MNLRNLCCCDVSFEFPRIFTNSEDCLVSYYDRAKWAMPARFLNNNINMIFNLNETFKNVYLVFFGVNKVALGKRKLARNIRDRFPVVP